MMIERRSVPRHQTAERATALFSANRTAPCVITDLSPKGARLGFGDMVELPQCFEIAFTKEPHRARLTVHTMWQHGRVAGVQFHPTIIEKMQALITRLIAAEVKTSASP